MSDRTEQNQQELESLKARLALHLEQERLILSGAAQAYAIGGRSLSRYQTSLKEVASQIALLKRQISDLEAQIEGNGQKRRMWSALFVDR